MGRVMHSGGGRAPFGAGDPDATRRARDLPRLLGIAIRLLWAADRRTFVLGALLQIVAGVGFAGQLLVANRLLRTLLAPDAGRRTFGTVAALLAVVGTVLAALAFATAAQAGVRKLLGERVVRHVQGLILDTAASVDVIEFEDPNFYDRLQRAQQQGVPTPLMISGALLEGSGALVAAAGIATALVVINPILLPLVVLGAVPAWLASTKSSQALYSFSYGNTENDRKRSALSQVVTVRGNADEARAFQLYPFIRERWESLYQQRIDEARSLVRRQLGHFGLASIVSSAVTTALFGLLAYLYLTGRTTAAAAATAAFAAQQLGTRLLGLAMASAVIYENVLYLDDFDGFVRMRERRATSADKVAAPPFDVVDVQNVSFQYPGSDREALADVSLSLRSGEIVALVGENGSGKTTLAKLLAGLYQPTSGTIRWDGVETASIASASIRSAIAVIFQDFVRYPLSAAENVSVGDTTRIDDRQGVQQAISAAAADDLVEGLERGLDTMLGKEFEGGADLSVGQWQRVALARAFFRDAPFIILDEPTAALDPRAERALFDSIRDLCAGRTVLLISHRFSSVRSADRIVVLDHGRVIEEGTHNDLMSRRGQYAELFSLQASAYLEPK